MNQAELHKVLREWNATDAPFPADKTLHGLFEEQVDRTPDDLAVVDQEGGLSYRELNERSNRLAHAIRAHHRTLRGADVLPDTLLGISMTRGTGMIVAMLGILKAGCAYVPMDPAYPVDRLRFMMEDSHSPIVVTDHLSLEKLLFLYEEDCGVISLDSGWEVISRYPARNPEPISHPHSLAYVIYTSGSTGRPKGVMIEHSNVVNFVCNEQVVRRMSRGHRALQFASINFDAAVADVFPTLCCGGTLYVISDEIRQDPEALFDYLKTHAIQGAILTPAVLRMLPRESLVTPSPPVAPLRGAECENPCGAAAPFPRGRGTLPSLTDIVVAGDVCDAQTVAFWREGRNLINAYGPTECTVGSTEMIYDEAALHNEIGRPLRNVKTYVLDTELNPVPIGQEGELFVGGAGVGRGYLNQPDLDRERFLDDPFATPAGRMYRSGDRVRWLESGSLLYVGRMDFQVKIRGFRVEPGEIEALLSAHGDIADCAVMAYDDGPEKRLAAYYVPAPGASPSTGSLKTYLREQVPSYMIPSAFVKMERLPLSPSGKLDRAALPAITGGLDAEPEAEYVAPASPTEQEVARIVAEVMNLRRVSSTSDFFEMGAHSLTAAQIASALRKSCSSKVGIRDVFLYPTVGALAAYIAHGEHRMEEAEALSIPRVPHRRMVPLTFQQEQIWFLSKLVPNNRAYNAQISMRIRGPLRVQILTQVLGEIIRRHEILRTTFHETSQGPIQVVHAPWKPVIKEVDLTHLPAKDRVPRADALIQEEMAGSFDITKLPLLGWVLYRLDPEDHLFFHIEHHFVHDGWSFAVFVRELKSLYTAYKENRPSPLEELPIQYADFAFWQRQRLSGKRLEDKLAYWVNRIKDFPQVLNLPTDRPRPPKQSFRGDAIRKNMDRRLYQALREFSRSRRATLFATMYSAFSVLLSRCSRQSRFLVGTGVANRATKETEALLGMLVNTVLLSTDLSENPTFAELLRTTREHMLVDAEHYDTPFMHIVERAKAGNLPGRNPLFQVLFAFHDSAVPLLEFADLRGRLLERHNATAKTDINVICIPRAEQHSAYQDARLDEEDLTILWEYNADLFSRATMESMLGRYLAILERVVLAAETPVQDIEMLMHGERDRVVHAFNDTALPYDRALTIHGAFEERVRLHPKKTAVLHRDQQMSYETLNARANAVAHRLRGRLEYPGTPIGICVERGFEMMVGILGILKAGGAYVPLPHNYPEGRLRFMMEDANIKVVLTQADLKQHLPILSEDGRETVVIEEGPVAPGDASPRSLRGTGTPPVLENLPPWSQAEDTAYIIYTSGSTGNPKGVCVPHRAVHNFVQSIGRDMVSEDDTLAQCANYAFDATVYEFWGSLLLGARMAIIDSAIVENPHSLNREFCEKGITGAFFTTALFNALVECAPEMFEELSHVIFGGEAANPATVRQLLRTKVASLSVYHAYGPTECTCFSTYCLLVDAYLDSHVMPIGSPLANYSAYVLDEKLHPVPVGVPGELYVGGDSLARGYLNRPQLTAERFVADPFTDGGRLYKTGDLARWLPGGRLEFLGRTDFQVKMRGFRVEPEEIEAVLLKNQGVKQAVVIPWEQQLVAYWRPREGPPPPRGGGGGGGGDEGPPRGETVPSTEELKAFLGRQLPAFMVPSIFIRVPSFKLTSNLKIDRASLPAPAADDLRGLRGSVVSPRTRTEEALVEVWKELLQQEGFGVTESFFDLGGNSILTVKMLSQLKKKLGVDVNVAQMFSQPTIAALAASIDGTGFTSGLAEDNLSMALRDARTNIRMDTQEDARRPAAAILLTGVTGFLGPYLLRALLSGTRAEIFCLVRGNQASVRGRLESTLSRYRMADLMGHPRVHPVSGDLEAEGLGISDETRERWATDIDDIVHCGALVHHVYDYAKLKRSNVLATVELLELAARGRRKGFHFISTLGTASIRDDEGNLVEVDANLDPVSTNGYTLSKWVAERIAENAARQGLDVNIFRPGNITGDSVAGICRPEVNHGLLLLKGCLQMGAAPDWKRSMEMVPVDILANAIVHFMLRSSGLKTYNMNNPMQIPWRDYLALLGECGFAVPTVKPSTWKENYLQRADESNAMYPLRGFYLNAKQDPLAHQWKPFFGHNSSQVQDCLSQTSIRYPRDYAPYLQVLLRYLTSSNFLPKPHAEKELSHV